MRPLIELAPSVISPDLIQSYLASRFVCDGSGKSAAERLDFVLSSGQPLPERARGKTSFAIVTAYNPFSQMRTELENKRANAELERDLDLLGKTRLPIEGGSASGEWKEPGFLIHDLSMSQAVELGRHYGQNAIVWGEGPDFIPRLMLLR